MSNSPRPGQLSRANRLFQILALSFAFALHGQWALDSPISTNASGSEKFFGRPIIPSEEPFAPLRFGPTLEGARQLQAREKALRGVSIQATNGSSEPATSSAKSIARKPLPPEQPLPKTGRLTHDFSDEPNSYLVVEPARTNLHLYVKVEQPASGKLIASMFIRAGEHFPMVLPNDTYVLKVASGTSWFGTNLLFGPHGFYAVLRPGIRMEPYDRHIITLKDEVLLPPHQEKVNWNQF